MASLHTLPIRGHVSRKAFKRVRMSCQADIDAAYQYISGCIENPRVADSLDELVVGNMHWANLRNQASRLVYPVDEATHGVLNLHVYGLRLQDNVTRRMIDALNWEKQMALGRPTGQLNVAVQNREFAATACVFMLSLCRNIATIHIDDMEAWENTSGPCILREYLMKRNYGVIRDSLKKLGTVIVSPVDTEGSYLSNQPQEYQDSAVTDIMRSFHRLPAIESFIFKGVTMVDSTSRWILPPSISNFNKLRLEHVDLNGVEIGSLIRTSKGLEEFTLSLGGLVQLLGSSISVRPKTLGKCLLEHKSTLRILDLDIQEARTSEPEEEHDAAEIFGADVNGEEICDLWHRMDMADGSGPLLPEDLPNTRHYGYGIGSLYDFTALTHLSVQPEKVAAEIETGRLVDMLPRSLEYLHLYGYERGKVTWLDEQVDELMAAKGEKLPNLKEVRGIGDEDEDEDDEEDEDEDDEDDDDDDEDEDEDDDEEEATWERPNPDLSWLEA